MKQHSERKHSKFSASGAERWFNCQGSVSLSEGLPDKESIWSKEGTRAHEVLEEIMNIAKEMNLRRIGHARFSPSTSREMVTYGLHAANFILEIQRDAPKSELLVETRISLPFIHKDMFGTFDGAVLDHFGTLHVFDYKYGAGHFVSPERNLQMIFYGLGLAHQYDWNFKKARLWIIQPRVKGYDGPQFWELSIAELQAFVSIFKAKVSLVERKPNQYEEGQWCFFCKAKSICPLKKDIKLEKAKNVFSKI